MTVEAGAAGPRVGPAVDAALNLRTGGICLIVGAVVFARWRLVHGDTPAADADAALNFVRNRPIYSSVHVFAVLAALVVVLGLLALTRSFDRPGSWSSGRQLWSAQRSGWPSSALRAQAKAWPCQNWLTPLRKSTLRNASNLLCRPCRGGSYSRTLSGGDGLDDRCSTPAVRDRDGA